MDITALLSPDEASSPELTPASGPGARQPRAKQSPRKQRATRPPPGQRTSSALSQEVRRSPDKPESGPSSRPSSSRGGVQHAPSQPHPLSHQTVPDATSGFRPTQQQQHTSHPQSGKYDGYAQRPVMQNRNSTPGMETLADLASMQQRPQPVRSLSGKSTDQETVRSSPSISSIPPPNLRNHSGQSLADLTMAEGPAQTPPPRRFSSSALSDAESKTVNELLNELHESSYSYPRHVQLINLLHKGFRANLRLPSDDGGRTPVDPHSYVLLNELRQAREAMDSRFAVGEDLWLDWLSDEILLANSSESRIAVTELFQKAVQDVPASVKIWQAYLNWIQACYSVCNDLPEADATGWSDDEKEMCKELFTLDMLITTAEQGAEATRWRLDESHLIWTRFAQLLIDNTPEPPPIPNIERIRDVFVQKLKTPHAGWGETAQMFWPVVNKYEPDNWETAMAQINDMAEPAKKEMSMREEHEHSLARAMQSGDKDAIYNNFTAYLRWEQTRRPKQQGPHSYNIRCGLYERALLHFPTYTEWWIEYVDFVTTHNPDSSVIPLIERATRHCPWSGDLWGQRILRSDVEGRSHEDIESTKHRATNSGLLDVGGMEELVKVLQQWCSYLRRHAFEKDSTEDDLDTAEVGITMALEDIQQAGKTLYGPDFQGDPLYRLESIQVKFLGQARRLNDARDIFKRLSAIHGSSANFWMQYYTWELMLWSFERISETRRIETTENGPHIASSVLQQALAQRDLDWPERILETYMNHFQQHESAEKLQVAMVSAREFTKSLAFKRAKEATEAAEVAAQQAAAAPAEATEAVANSGASKRKAEDTLANGATQKKSKTDEAVETNGDAAFSAEAQVKRDREHNTLTLKNLPGDVKELDIKKFFRDISVPKSMNIIPDSSSGTATATVEFESQEDVLAAKTRNGRDFNGNEVSISSGGQSTLYVANYPAEYDEAAVNGLFEAYGEIVSVRFPSLKFNNRRRFCYVSFLTEAMAKAAEAAMDGKMLDGQHRLLAKLSDPDRKKQRSGAQAEGREVIVKNMPWTTTEDEVKKFFSEYGDVSSIKLLKLINGRLTGTGFIVYETVDEAHAAASGANNKPFGDRILHVELTTPKGGATAHDKSRKTDVIIKNDHDRRASDASMTSADNAVNNDAARTARERKIAILDLAETVNDARVKAAMEAHGPIVKIQLRRQDRGAIVEFATVNDAFNVRQGVDCSALGPNARSGDVSELLNKVKSRQSGGGEGGAPAKSALGMRPSTIARPAQPRGGRRGGLGTKRGGLGFSSANAEAKRESDNAAAGVEKGAKKSNDDFRAMLEKSREVAEKAKAEEDAEN